MSKVCASLSTYLGCRVWWNSYQQSFFYSTKALYCGGSLTLWTWNPIIIGFLVVNEDLKDLKMNISTF